jgi:hypothetical protein
MNSSELVVLLNSLSSVLPVKILNGEDNRLFFVGQVYHEPPRTFIQGTEVQGKYSSVKGLLERLKNIDTTVPFDADIVSGDDWNFQKIQDIAEVNGELIIKLSKPVMD